MTRDLAQAEMATPASTDAVRLAEPHAARIVVLTAGGPLPWIIINALIARFGPVTVLEEEPEPMRLLFRRRLAKLGPVTVAGQIGFGMLQRLLARASAGRRAAILAEHHLDERPSARARRIPVCSVNAPECRAALAVLRPQVVLVVGTRMIKSDTLAAIDVPIINYHAGINPAYRGMCGGYWALASGEPEHFGVTAHLVDAGVDTGGILHWSAARAAPQDNFATYPFILAAAAVPVVQRAIEDALSGSILCTSRDLPLRQWYHPTLWGYLWTGFTRGVW